MIALAGLAVAGSLGLAGSVETARPCPPACSTTINVRISPGQGSPNDALRYFLGVFPVEQGHANQSVGGYWTGQGWEIGQVPVSFHRGQRAALAQRIVIPEGICALARQAGATGTFAVYAGYGQDVLAEQTREVQAIEQSIAGREGPQVEEMRAVVQAFRTAAGDDPRMGDVAAAHDMRESGSVREIGRVVCR